ncbi:Pseudaminic acid synthase [Candidatus Terasakiella magnetica]|uniref:Pseudaminic acid synthase n=2 Tax=Candidatus Terasakiella magnetica TaxID=1867952 RepID=A0A1C3RKW4_9PROT|nr:Pseudaminic acid synthase [Candidatus Terasakiella magnetica]
MRTINISNRPIGQGQPPYMIAEISANHGGDIERAKRIIEQSAKSGADAVKFQLYTADSLTLNCPQEDFLITGESLWKGRRLYELYEEAATPYEWFEELFAHARKHNVTPFASVFDEAGIEFMENLGAEAYKIASFETVDLGLISACAKTGKPLIISTGLCTLEDIQDAVDAFHDAGGTELILLQCNSSYPANPKESHLVNIPDMAKHFNVPIGYSDHTTTSVQAIAAVALGATVIEKHVIDAREPATADSAFSSLPEQFLELCDSCLAAFHARGEISYGPTEHEKGSIKFRRSLYVCKDIKQGEAFSKENVRSVRPGYGLAPKHLENVLKGKATQDLVAGTPVSWDVVE